MPELTPEQMAVYREGARRRWLQEQQELARRRERALALARQAAMVLREDFGAEMVVLFGSLARAGVFDAHSEDIARETEEGIPTGPDWHQSLLLQVSAEIPGTRPPAITQETRYCLDEYRSFRHLIHNIYTFNLRPDRLKEQAEGLQACYEAVVHDLRAFTSFLECLDRGLDQGWEALLPVKAMSGD